jgi:hypothetical protein
MGIFNIEELRFDAPSVIQQEKKAAPSRPKYRSFIQGPIDFDWVKKSAALPGKASLVGIAIWFVSGMAKSNTFTIQGQVLDDLGISHKAFNRALNKLAEIGLITVNRRPGRSPEINLLPTPQDDQEQQTPRGNQYWRRDSYSGAGPKRKSQNGGYLQFVKTKKA